MTLKLAGNHEASSDSDSNSSSGVPIRKRQRLTHLSPEEKALHRKLKNRDAAQTARGREKAKMRELEQQVLGSLELGNQKLHIENRLLREKTSVLITENKELRQRLGLDSLDSKEQVPKGVNVGNDMRERSHSDFSTSLGAVAAEAEIHVSSDAVSGV
ncbi:X-box-binding protein 1-like [Tautogolabrus adspersus]